MEKAGDCIPMKSTDWEYEISCYDGSRYSVDLRVHTYSCRKWELSGIPCKHDINAICCQMLNPEDFVYDCYSVETYNKVYEPAIKLMDRPSLWDKTCYIPHFSPNFGRKKGGLQEQEDMSQMNSQGRPMKVGER